MSEKDSLGITEEDCYFTKKGLALVRQSWEMELPFFERRIVELLTSMQFIRRPSTIWETVPPDILLKMESKGYLHLDMEAKIDLQIGTIKYEKGVPD